MRRRILCFLALVLCPVHAAFGNAFVQWDSANPSVRTDDVPLQDFKPPQGTRRNGLEALGIEPLVQILEGLGSTECKLCNTKGHYISKIRAAVLALGPKAVKSQLARRGLTCSGCSSREQFLDQLLDSVHLPLRQLKPTG